MQRFFEIWDEVAIFIYDFIAVIKYYVLDQFKFKRMLKANCQLKDKHKGQRCFVVLNGPSINQIDLEPLKNEVTFCANYFHLSGKLEAVNPDYYCIVDSGTFDEDRIHLVYDILEKTPKSTFIFNKKAMSKFDKYQQSKIHYVYGMHMPSSRGVRENLSSISSSFTNVGCFCILAAMYMGFTEINLLGLDFQPGAGLPHCYELTEEEQAVYNTANSKKRLDACMYYWSYYLAQMQNFHLSSAAQKKNIKINNLNPDSYIKAYSFADYGKKMEKFNDNNEKIES